MEVCETGSYSLVAKKFGYTHSGISYMIRSLEEEFGFPLIERVDNHFEPTEKALKILKYYNRSAVVARTVAR